MVQVKLRSLQNSTKWALSSQVLLNTSCRFFSDLLKILEVCAKYFTFLNAYESCKLPDLTRKFVGRFRFLHFPPICRDERRKRRIYQQKRPPQKKIKIKIVDTNKEEYCQKLCICWLPIKYKNLFKLEDDPICNGILID